MPSKTRSATGESGHAGAYLGWNGLDENGSGLMLKAGGEYGWGAAQIRRTVSSTGETDTDHQSADTAQIFGEAAFRDHFLGADLEPHADVFWVMAENGAFAESGGSQAMSGTGITEDASFARLGVRGLGRYIDLGGGVEVAPSLDIGWQVALSNPTPGVTVGFATGTPTLLLGTPAAVNSGTAQLGLAVKLGDSADLHLGYDGIFSSGEVDHGVTARLEWRF
jgi:subtilase-type serine protease